MKFAEATKFHRKSGYGLGINPKAMSAVGAALKPHADPYWPGVNNSNRTFHVTDCPGRSVTIPVSMPFHCFPNGST